ncbi:acyltransferase family protein [Candidatus Poribacteria bacterium]|nr:acyltransferase family protein [Candidatus Poribacteria bacterium]
MPARSNINIIGIGFPLIPPQWISYFILGIMAYWNRWLTELPDKVAKFWLIIVLINFVMLPVALSISRIVLKNDDSVFLGGLNWQALIYAIWQQLLCMGIIICLVIFFRKRVNNSGWLAWNMAKSSYTAYIIHAPVLVAFGLILRHMPVYPLVKFAAGALIIVPVCFVIANYIRKLPLANKIL